MNKALHSLKQLSHFAGSRRLSNSSPSHLIPKQYLLLFSNHQLSRAPSPRPLPYFSSDRYFRTGRDPASKDISLPRGVRAAMEIQAEAERKKRAQILESEGERQANINIADGRKSSVILASEAAKMNQVNRYGLKRKLKPSEQEEIILKP